MRRLLSMLFGATLLAGAQPDHGPLCEIGPAHAENALEYVQTLIKTLGVANRALLQYENPDTTNPILAQALEDMARQILDRKHLNEEYQCSADMVEGYQGSKMIFVRQSASGMHEFFQTMILINATVIAGLRFAISNAGKPTFDAGQFADDMTGFRLSIDGMLKTVPTLVEAGIYGIAQMPREEAVGVKPLRDEHFTRLTITSNEARGLVALIDREFPRMKPGVKGTPTTFETGAYMIRRSLTDGTLKTTDQR